MRAIANHKREMLGSWVLAPEPKRTVTFLEGLEERYGKQNIYFASIYYSTNRVHHSQQFDRGTRLNIQLT